VFGPRAGSLRSRPIRSALSTSILLDEQLNRRPMTVKFVSGSCRQFLCETASRLDVTTSIPMLKGLANTVLHWLEEAAEQLRAFSASFLCDVHVEQLQLDELYAVLRDFKAGAISEDEAMERLERSPDWVWTAMDSKSKLLVVVDVGTRTLAMAQRVL